MKIKRLEIKNYTGISEFAQELGKINIFSGRIGSGKSSIVDAIKKGFTNQSSRVEAIRHGEDEATIFIQTDTGLEVDRRLRTDKADYLKIRKHGEAVPQTETFLRKLVNGDIFRPVEFIQKTPEEQAKIILNMLEIPWTMDDIETWFSEIPQGINYEAHILQVLKQIEQQYYTQREGVNREIKVLEAQIKGIKDELPPNYDGEHWRAQNVQELYQKVAEAQEINKKIATARALIDGLEAKIASIKNEAENEKQAKINAFDRQRNEIAEFKQFLNQKIASGEDAISKADERIKQAEETLNLELQRKIQELKEEYACKKEESRKSIQSETEQTKVQIA